jgi:hypothetical protein
LRRLGTITTDPEYRLEANEEAPRASLQEWSSIASFPLVDMAAAILLYFTSAAFGILLGSLVPGSPAGSIAKDAIVLGLMIATYKLLIVRLGEIPRDDLEVTDSLPGLGKGVLAGLVIFTVVVGIAFALGVYKIVGGGNFSGMLAALVGVAMVPAFTEELLFRGILFRWIEEFAGSWVALGLTSALFGLAHILNPGATWFSSLAIAVEAGLLLGAVYMLTRSLWMPIGLHAAWNFVEGPVFGVPVSGGPASGAIRASITGPQLLSGGPFGLEGSVIAVVVATSAGVWFLRLAIKRGELVRPSWGRHRAA